MTVSGVLACALSLAALAQLSGSPTPSPLRTQITNLSDGFKLRPGERVTVQIRVDGGVKTSLRWTLSLRGPDAPAAMELAAGAGGVDGTVVAQLSADELTPGTSYSLQLAATDGETSSSTTVQMLVTDPAYALIPMEEGNRSQSVNDVYDTNASGTRLLYSGPLADPMQLFLLDRASGSRNILRVPVWDTEGARLTPDGSQFCFYGLFSSSGLGCFDFGSNIATLIDRSGSNFYSSDSTGKRFVYWGPATDSVQYFLYDRTTGTRRQLTDDPDAAKVSSDLTYCPQPAGTRPFISGDGLTVVIITHATLGLVPPDDSVGCRIFVYDVEHDSWRQAAALPASIVLDIPALSSDARWLSFPAFVRPPRNSVPLLVDLQSGELQDPAVDVEPWASFDAAITGDGSGIVVSTEADLDPRVGNADHNMELFYYDFARREARQITETVGGIDSTSGNCDPYRPAVSSDGSVVVIDGFKFLSIRPCQLDGPQRNERDGFIYRFVRAVRRRPGNRGPQFVPIPDQNVLAGDTLTVSLSAQDPDGDPVSFFAQVKDGEDVPPGSLITDHHDGTATFAWPTRPENAGTTVLRVAAYDEGGGEVVQDVTITVAASDRPPTASATPAPTSPAPTATAPLAPTPTAVAPAACPADCNGDRQVTIAELLTATNIALGASALSACPAAACDTNDAVTINCLLRAVGAALTGCP